MLLFSKTRYKTGCTMPSSSRPPIGLPLREKENHALPRIRPTRELTATTTVSVITATVNRKHRSTMVEVMDRAMLENIKLKPKITKAMHAVMTARVCLREFDMIPRPFRESVPNITMKKPLPQGIFSDLTHILTGI